MKKEKQNKSEIIQNTRSFDELFIKEILKSERLRAFILIGLLGLEAFMMIIIYVFNKEQYFALFNTSIAFFAILIFTLIIIIYEFLIQYFFKKKITKFAKHSKIIAYLNIFAEISLLSVLFIFISEYTQQTEIFMSPATLTYFIFIILSTLWLNAKLSIFAGLLAAIEFIIISCYYSSQFANLSNDNTFPFLTEMHYLGQGVILMISGIAAAFVANLIKRKMIISWENMKEKEIVIDLFGQQISKQVATKILDQKEELSGTRKMVCVMFLDIRDFTPFVDNHTPEEVVTYLNKLFHFMIDIVQMHNGVINQFLGDGFMATFGAPVSVENISQHAVQASLEIIHKLEEKNNKRQIPETRIGIGIHYGEAVVGNIGSSIRKQYSITGNVVIFASRIEQLNKTFKSSMIISEQIYFQLNNSMKNLFKLEENVLIKGYNQPVSIYVLDTKKDDKD